VLWNADAIVFDTQVEASGGDPGFDADGTAFHLIAEAVLHGVFDQRLQQHAGNEHIERVRIDVAFKAQLIAEADEFDRQVIVDEFELIAQARHAFVFAQQAAEDAGEFQDHLAGAVGVDPDERGYRVQSIEEEVGIDLAGERLQTRFDEEPVLFLQFDFVARGVPDLDGERDGEIDGRVNGQNAPPCAIFGRGIEREHVGAFEGVGDGLAQEFRGDDTDEQDQVKHGPSEVAALAERLKEAQVEERRSAPDVVFVGGEIAQHAAEQSDPGIEGEGGELSMEERREGDQQARGHAGDVAAEQSGEQAAFETKIGGVVGFHADAQEDAGGEHGAEPQRELQALAEGPVLLNEELPQTPEPHKETGQGRHHSDADQQRDKVLFHPRPL